MERDTIKKRYYKIGELAKLHDVSTTWIRQICKDYNIEAMRRPGGMRVFTAEQAQEIAIIIETQKVRRVDAIKTLLYMRYPRTFSRFKSELVNI